MKSFSQRISAFTVAFVMVATLIFTSGLSISQIAFADESKDYCNKYFYKQLSENPLAENFYNVFDSLFVKGEFKKGTLQYDLIENGVATEEQVASYVEGTSDQLI